MKTYTIDLKLIDRSIGENIYSPIIRGLELSNRCGKNLDALWDMLTGQIELPCRIIFLSKAELREDETAVFKRILRVIDMAVDEGAQIEYEVFDSSAVGSIQ